MTSPNSPTCPRCGAGIQVTPATQYATCTYCGTQTFVGAKAPVTAPRAAPSSVPVGCFVALGALLLSLVAGAAFFLVMRGSSTDASTTVSVDVAKTKTSAESATPGVPVIEGAPARPEAPKPPRLETRRVPLLADLNGDQVLDFVVVAAFPEDKGGRRYVGVNGVNGVPTFRTKVLASDVLSSDAVLEHSRLIVADRKGTLTAFDTRSGDEQWTTALGDRVQQFCVAKESDSVRVQTADLRTTALDVKTGRQTTVPGKPACQRANANVENRFHDPGDRSDRNAPPGVESVVCGSVRVMGDRNFFVPDQCRARAGIDPDKVDGMGVRALWKHGKGYLAIGFRQPGTRIPMLGYLEGRKLFWKSDVPPENPLDARPNAPEHVRLANGVLYAGYEPERSGHPAGLTAIEAATGKRLWSARLPGKLSNISHLVAAGDTVLVLAGDSAFGFGAKDGQQRFLVGDGE